MGLEFNAENHVYTYDGISVPSVTTVLDATLDQFANVPADKLEFAQQRGTAVHTATALYDLDDLDVETLDSQLIPYLDAWISFRKDTGFVPQSIESRLFHKRHWYAGTYDRIGKLFDNDCVIDIKSGALMPSAGPQSAAYFEAYNYHRSEKLKTRWVIQLKPNGTYAVHQMQDKEDLSVFLACHTIFQWRMKNDC